jgi:hypothetical protein
LAWRSRATHKGARGSWGKKHKVLRCTSHSASTWGW